MCIDNKCEHNGNCRIFMTQNEICNCKPLFPGPLDAPGKCPSANGRHVTKEEVHLDCCELGCYMTAQEYANWDGTCPLKEE